MGSNTRNLYNLKNGANKLAEIDVTKGMIDTMVENLQYIDLNAKFRYNIATNSFEGYNGTEWDDIGNGQTLGTADVRAIQYLAQSTDEALVIPDGTNAMAIDSITIADGGSITVPDGSVFKVV